MNDRLRIDATIEIYDQDRRLILESGGQSFSRTMQIMRPSDKYKALIGDGNARVSVGLDESIGGPYGYSIVKLRVNVTLACDQNEETIGKAKLAALDEGMTFIEDHLGTCHKMLCDHLERYYNQEQ